MVQSVESQVLTLDDVDRDVLWDIVTLGSCPLPKSVIPPRREYPLWESLDPNPKVNKDYFGRFLEEAKLAVLSQMLLYLPVGVWMSGGVDSSTLLHCLLQYLPEDKVKGFFLDFGNEPFGSELPYAKRLAEHYGIDLIIREVRPKDVIPLIPDMIQVQRSPIDALGVLPLAKLCKESGFTMCFSALGMDECMGGYSVHVGASERDWRVVEDAQLWRCQSYFHWINKSHSEKYVDLRFPFLNKSFVEYCRSLPRSHKVRGRDTKVRLREELLRFTDVPYENVMAGREVGTKGGFTPYLEDWWTRGLGDWCDSNFPKGYFHLLDKAKLKFISKYGVTDLSLWVRLRAATCNVFLDMVSDGQFTA
jgi:asparagine synthetase B (glutamine-hydrolysing)